MASDQVLVSVSFRDIPLYSRAVLGEVDGARGFLRCESPMPVGSMLILTPLRQAELRVPARVVRIVEACRGVKTEAAPGMGVVFEAAGEALLPLREETSEADAVPVAVAPPPTPAPAPPVPRTPTPRRAEPERRIESGGSASKAVTGEAVVYVRPAPPRVTAPKVIVEAPPSNVIVGEAEVRTAPGPAPEPATVIVDDGAASAPTFVVDVPLPPSAKGPAVEATAAEATAAEATARPKPRLEIVPDPPEGAVEDKVIYEIEADYDAPSLAPAAATPAAAAAVAAAAPEDDEEGEEAEGEGGEGGEGESEGEKKKRRGRRGGRRRKKK